MVEHLNLLSDTGYVAETSNSQTRFITGFSFLGVPYRNGVWWNFIRRKDFLKENNAVDKTELHQGNNVQYLNGRNNNNIPPSSVPFQNNHHEKVEEGDTNLHYFNF